MRRAIFASSQSTVRLAKDLEPAGRFPLHGIGVVSQDPFVSAVLVRRVRYTPSSVTSVPFGLSLNQPRRPGV